MRRSLIFFSLWSLDLWDLRTLRKPLSDQDGNLDSSTSQLFSDMDQGLEIVWRAFA